MLHQYSLEALGTQRHIAFDVSEFDIHDDAITGLIQNFESRYSRFLSGSVLSKVNKHKIIQADKEFIDLLTVGYQAYKKTGGIFSPFVGSSLEDLGYDQNYSFQVSSQPPSTPEAIFSIQDQKVTVGPKTSIDLGGYGKGYLIDLIAAYLRTNQISNRIINGGGDIRFSWTDDVYKKPIGIPHPNDATILIAERSSSGGAIGTSSSEQRKRKDKHHLIDPSTGNSTQNNILSVSVFAETACLADIGATTLFVGGTKKLAALASSLGVTYLALLKDNTILSSNDIDGLELYIQ